MSRCLNSLYQGYPGGRLLSPTSQDYPGKASCNLPIEATLYIRGYPEASYGSLQVGISTLYIGATLEQAPVAYKSGLP